MTEQIRKNVRFIDVLQHFLNRGLQSWTQPGNNKLDREAMAGMYAYIQKSVHELFSKSSQNFTEHTKDWIAQQLYLSIKIGGAGEIITPDGENLHKTVPVFVPTDIKLIPTDELRIVGGLLSDCDFAPLLAAEIRRRA